MAKVQNIADIEDINDVIKAIGESFNLVFKPNELNEVHTFGELCDAIIAKIELQNADDNTNQQAFYKLRTAIVKECGLKKTDIITTTNLETIFPREDRRFKVKRLEDALGFQLKILRPKHIVVNTLLLALLGSIVWVFFQHLYGFYAIVASILLVVLAEKTGKEFMVKTVGEAAEKMTAEHYAESRRNPETVNRKEIVKQIKRLFIDKLAINTINPDTIIVERKENL